MEYLAIDMASLLASQDEILTADTAYALAWETSAYSL
jgi:hypothetical protein